MSQNRSNVVEIGHGHDELNFPVTVLEDTLTGARYLSYDVETWWQRAQYLTHLDAIGRRSDVEHTFTEIIPVE